MTSGPATHRSNRILVAGIGNVFLGDDGFGVDVVHRVDGRALPECVDVVDYGIRGVHLAYDLLDGAYRTLIMVDAVPLNEPPGTLAVLELDERPPSTEAHERRAITPVMDAHSMSPDVVLKLLHGLGGHVERTLVVGCQPTVTAARMTLSGPVRAALGDAVRMVLRVATEEAAKLTTRNTLPAPTE